MAGKKSILKKLFSKPNQDCCNVEIEEKSMENESCCESTTENTEEQQKEA